MRKDFQAYRTLSSRCIEGKNRERERERKREYEEETYWEIFLLLHHRVVPFSDESAGSLFLFLTHLLQLTVDMLNNQINGHHVAPT